MKRRFLDLIKIYAIAICVFIPVLSCQEEPEIQDVIPQHYKQVTFKAAIDDKSEFTRTIRNEDGSLSWLPNDEIIIFCGQDIYGRFIADNTEIASQTTFTGHFNKDITESSNQEYWAVYPYMSTNSFDGNSVTLSVPSIQVSSPGTFGAGSFPSVAKSNNTSLTFYNVCGCIKFSLSRGDIDMITLVSKGEEPLAGSVRVTFGTDGKPVAQALEGVNEVTLRPSNSSCFEQGRYYYMTVLPVTMSSGFTMTFHTIDGEEGTLESSKSVTIRRSASSKRDNLDTYASNWHDTGSGQDFSETGVYLGILAFNQSINTCPVGLLTPESLSTYKSFIDGLQMKNGTILYYAVDNGLSNMQQGQSPKSLTNASLVTFTDGLDQGSLMMNSDYETEDKYLSAVSSRIHNGAVFGMPLSAFSIGIRGKDVQNTDKFKNNLVSLSSSEENAYEISEMSELNARFEDVAKNVVLIDYCYDLSLTIPGMPDGSKVRFTFDNVSDASSSNLYIEGTFNLRSRSLSNVTFTGLSSRNGSSVTGIENDIFVKYVFSKVRRIDGKELSLDYVKQWQSVSGGTGWQINSEFDSSSDTDIAVSVSRKSAIVYLVLDCSSSLGNQFSTMKEYAKNFIQKLYDDSYIDTKVKSIKISSHDASLEKGKTMKLSAMVYPVTALDRTVSWGSSNTNVITVDADGLVTGVSSGGAYIHATSNDGGYRAFCYVTVFEQPEQTQGQPTFSQSGLYLGVLAFNQDLYRYPICRLTSINVETICSFIDNAPVKNGSLVYYSADQAISDIQQPNYPTDLTNAALVTFTDCLDQGSLMKSSYLSNGSYLSAVKQKISNARVKSLPLNAYSIGIRGNDVTDISGYKANLEKLANSESNAYEITSINSLQTKLNDIADVVSIENEYTYSCNLKVTIPGPGNGTRVRFTFDNVNHASQSNLYIEGTFNLNNRSLTNVSYSGFSVYPSSTVSGVVEGIFVTYSFNNLQKTDNTRLSTQYMKEWTYDSGQSTWQINSEFNNTSDATTEVTQTVSKKSGVIYLVLDYSTSIGNESSTMKSAAKSFIRSLQQKSYDPTSVSGITLSKSSWKTTCGTTITLSATVLPESALDKTVSWKSTNTSVATVSSDGLVTAVGPGTCIIEATTNDGGYTAGCEVTVDRLVESITLDKTEMEICVGDNPVVLTAIVLPEDASNKSLTWTSSKNSVAKVDSEGKVTAVSIGTATIKVKSTDGSELSASCKVTVLPHVESVSLDKTELSLYAGKTATLSATVLPSTTNKNVTWTSSDESVAMVDQSGKVTAMTPGTTTIKATAFDGKMASCTVLVKPIPDGAIDLGLSVLWATFNVGANNPEDYGYYFAWGETEPKSDYSWETYKLSKGTSNTITKYNTDRTSGFFDNKFSLEPEDDAAHVNWGGTWRMPTDIEWMELLGNCTCDWTTLNGVSGLKITSNKTGYTNQCIFIPAAGYRYGTALKYAGSKGTCWSSSLRMGTGGGTKYAEAICFTVDYLDNTYRMSREIGLPIRPVTE